MRPATLCAALRALVIGAVLCLGLAPARADQVTVFAAASLKSALEKIGAAWAGESGHQVVFSFASSATLARQIQAGAPADLILTASADWMQALVESGDVRPESRRDLLTNRLVLVARAGLPAPWHGASTTLDNPQQIKDLLQDVTLAMALVDAVPAGIYGKQALHSLGLWDGLQPRVVQAENVTAALQFVASGAVDYGIVYATDAQGTPNVQLIGTFAPESHDPILYPAAITRQSRHPQAAADLLRYLTRPAARAVWQQAGFGVLE